MAAGDIARGGAGDDQTAALLEGADHVLALGDLAYPDGTRQDFEEEYDPSWGAHRDKTHPVPGNHEWHTEDAAGYAGYWRESPPYWYTWTLPGWRMIALDSSCAKVGGCAAGSPQYEFLERTLAANEEPCILAYWHHPRFSVGRYEPGMGIVQPFWRLLAQHGADLVLTGHDHSYQRWARLDASGDRSPDGIRQFVSGEGGASHYPVTSDDRVQAAQSGTYGVLRLFLKPSGYAWRFIPVAGETYTDAGQASCHT